MTSETIIIAFLIGMVLGLIVGISLARPHIVT